MEAPAHRTCAAGKSMTTASTDQCGLLTLSWRRCSQRPIQARAPRAHFHHDACGTRGSDHEQGPAHGRLPGIVPAVGPAPHSIGFGARCKTSARRTRGDSRLHWRLVPVSAIASNDLLAVSGRSPRTAAYGVSARRPPGRSWASLPLGSERATSSRPCIAKRLENCRWYCGSRGDRVDGSQGSRSAMDLSTLFLIRCR